MATVVRDGRSARSSLSADDMIFAQRGDRGLVVA
jgi:hypothetical protein